MVEREILESWKEIASYLKRDIKTCRRWEQKYGLPIRRLDNSAKARVFAHKSEIDSWLSNKLEDGGKTWSNTFFFKAKKSNKWLIGAVSTLLAVVVLVVLRFQIYPNLISTSSSSEEPFICVMPFIDNTGDIERAYFSTTLTNLLISELFQSKSFKVLTEEKLFAVLEDLGIQDKITFTSHDYRRIAQRAGISHILQGSFAKAGNKYRVNVFMHDPSQEKAIWSEKVEGSDEELFPMVDGLYIKINSHYQPRDLTEKK